MILNKYFLQLIVKYFENFYIKNYCDVNCSLLLDFVLGWRNCCRDWAPNGVRSNQYSALEGAEVTRDDQGDTGMYVA